ncbi:MAG: ferredoxin [bacterium]|nr:MAG: ferredoxin [bacterium]
MAHFIDQNLCTDCGRCPPVYPVGAISGGKDYYEIDPETCCDCKGFFEDPLCVEECPIEGAIRQLEIE